MAKIGKPKTTKAKGFGARRKGDKAPTKTKAQEYRDAAGTGMALDAHMVDKEEGRLVKGRGDTNPKTRKKRRGKVQAKSIGGDVMGTIRDMARSEGWMTGQDDERDVREYLQTKATNAMFDRAEKEEKKKKAKSKRRKPSKSTLAAARRAAGNIRLKKGGYTSQNKKYGGGIYPKVGK